MDALRRFRAVTLESTDFVKTFWAENPPQHKIDALKKATQKHTAITKECAKAQGQDRHLYALYCVWQRAVDEEGTEAASSNGMSSNGYSSPTEALSDGEHGSPTRPTSGIPYDENGPPPGRGPSAASQMPGIFADAGWDKINNTILSTSNCGNPALRHFGFGPSSGEGFGIGYIIKDETISICASSKHRQTKRFVDSIESYLMEIRKLLRAVHQGKSKSASRAREAEERPEKASQKKGGGRAIKGEAEAGEDSKPESDDDGLGGCECFPITITVFEHIILTDFACRWFL